MGCPMVSAKDFRQFDRVRVDSGFKSNDRDEVDLKIGWKGTIRDIDEGAAWIRFDDYPAKSCRVEVQNFGKLKIQALRLIRDNQRGDARKD